MIIRRYTDSDKAQVLALLANAYGGWNEANPEAYWNWKFEQNPHGPGLIWLAEEESQIIGCYILLPVRLQTRGRTILGAQSVDAAIHPDHQGRGLFTLMAKTAMAEAGEVGVALTFAFPTMGAYKGQVKVGFQDAGVTRRCHRLLVVNPKLRISDDLEVAPVVKFDTGFSRSTDWSADGGWTAIDRDGPYLEWRYAQNPVKRYEILECRRGDEVLGYSIYSRDGIPAKLGLNRGYIYDLVVNPDDQAAADALIAETLKRMRRSRILLATTWQLPEGLERRCLESLGVSPRLEQWRDRVSDQRRDGPFITFANAPEGNGEVTPWFLMPGDTDYM